MTDTRETSSAKRLSEANEKALKALRYERGQLKATLTRFETFLNGNPEPELIAQRRQRIESTLSAFEVVQRSIATKEDVSEDGEKEITEFEDKYYELLLRASRMVRPASAAASVPSTSGMASYSHDAGHIDLSGRLLSQSSTKLPAISIPTFSGNYLEWEAFRDMFVSLVHANTGLTNVQRFHYLKSNLRGEALAPLENYAITDANYVEAWDELQSRYNNKRVLLNNHWRAFSALTPVTRESASSLNALFSGIARVRHAIKSLGRANSAWEDWLVYFTVKRLDVTTRRDWERSLGKCTDPPTFEALNAFVEGRIQALESFPPVLPKQPTVARTSQLRSTKAHHAGTASSGTATSLSTGCAHCKGAHYFGYCPKMQALAPAQRRALVAKLRLCFNCLRPGHRQGACPSSKRCSSCHERHHTTLHDTVTAASSQPASRAASPPPQEQDLSPPLTERPARAHHAAPDATSQVILATAVVKLHSSTGRTAEVRALLDPGAELSFITESIVQTLRLPRKPSDVNIVGIGGSVMGCSKHVTEVQLSPRLDSNVRFNVRACVLTKVTSSLPSTASDHRNWPHLQNLSPLADPGDGGFSRIDLVLGADVYGALLLPDVRQGPSGSPTAQLTRLGWTIFGPVNNRATKSYRQRAIVNACHTTAVWEVSDLLRKFWELEEIPAQPLLSPEDELCEQHYVATHRRTSQGRYVVRLPFKSSTLPAWTDSLPIALSCLTRLEKRCSNDPQYRSQYASFLREYEELQHMQAVSGHRQDAATTPFYLPHHGVLRENSGDAKIRVVFNASQKTRSGTSLNDHLLVGPTLQRDLVDVVLSWRMHAVVLTADIEKMYRQILVDENDAELQRIVWREEPSQPVRHFRLSTVTYGTACAPYLAIRTLMQLADDEGSRFPRAAEAIRRNSYVDDILSGADDVDSARSLREELIGLLQAGGFELRKWSSNRAELLTDFPSEWLQTSSSRALGDERIKALGLEWSPQHDNFSFQVSLQPTATQPTKRSLLSTIAKLFDPVGWIAPAIVTGKILIQDLWLIGADWDAPLSGQLADSWRAFYADLPALEGVSIPRWIGYSGSDATFQLHGFADASSRAYAAVVYLRAQRTSGVVISLLAAKTKVAPVKQVSIPRLELCGAALLSRLMAHVRTALNLPDVSIYLWSDSQVVLAWLRAHPTRWTTFVANRVSLIQCALPDALWRHVPTKDNPADLASRGVSPAVLPNLSLWWNGPLWLKEDAQRWPSPTDSGTTDVEARSAAKTHATFVRPTWNLLSKYSNLTKLWRVTAWCRRFFTNCRSPANRLRGPLTSDELHSSRLLCIATVQAVSFADAIDTLTAGKELPRNSQLLRLRPFIDQHGILRVGGRLQRSNLDYDGRHPALLPKRSPLTALLIADAHSRVLHGGIQLTLSHLMTRYWILGARNLVRAYIHRCIKCCRLRAVTISPVMGNLPASRVTPTRPFLRTGVDYAGPIQIRTTKGRGHKSMKGYIALFICLWSKAIHLEAVSDCSTSAFLAAFRRFVSRRGLCREMLSDNGTNFHGADAELRRMFQESSAFQQDIAALIAHDGTSWRFIPPSAPHFGGLWEAGVRSTKHHLRRVIGESTLTFEELTTVLAQIEACLNSRPLTPLSVDPTDFGALTPGHFLIGEPLLAVPEPSTLDIPLNRLTRWQLTTNMRDHFWRRWSSEYLHQMQQRSKWSSNGEQLQVGRLVLLKDDRLPPTKWLTGRIIAVHPGTDDVVRVVTVRTPTTTLKRPVAKLCTLPDDLPQSS